MDLRADFILAASYPASDRSRSARRAGVALAMHQFSDQLDPHHLRAMIALLDQVPGTAARLWDTAAAALAIPIRLTDEL